MIGTALNVVALVIALIVVIVVILNWRADRTFDGWAERKWYEKGFKVCRDSATMLLGYAQIVAAAVIENIESLANALNMPQITDVLEKHFDPKVAGTVLLVSGLFIVWARGRTLVR